MTETTSTSKRPAYAARSVALATFVVVAFELLSAILAGAGLAAAHPTVSPASSSPRMPLMSVDAAVVSSAEASLQLGGGPAHGLPWQCSSLGRGSTAACGSGSITASPFTTPSWTPVLPGVPSVRLGASMVYDARDGYVLLFAGIDSSGALGDTWKYSGGTWTELAPSPSPSARGYASVAFDTADNYVVLFGGWTGSVALADTWKFAGGSWTMLSPATSPSGVFGASMSYDTKDGYVVLFGGDSSSFVMQSGTWKFVGGAWTKLAPATHPGARYDAAFAYDTKDGYLVLFGGYGSSTMSDTWKFTSGNWTKLTPASHPSVRDASTLGYSSKDGELVLFGGWSGSKALSDTWTFVGGSWTKISTLLHPTSRLLSALSDGPSSGVVVLFGGQNAASAFLNDTWTFNGIVWTHILPHVPAARIGASMTYDEADGYVLLFGGSTSAGTLLADTWKFAHGVWTQLHPANSPSPRDYASMAYDQADGCVVLFGGTNGNITVFDSDTWTFVGGVWSNNVSSTGPAGRESAYMTYDAADGYILLYGGSYGLSSVDAYSDTWAYSGGVWWDPLTSTTAPDARAYGSMTYDSEDGYVVLFGGQTTAPSPVVPSTWTYLAGLWTNITSSLSTSPTFGTLGGLVDDTYDGYVVQYGAYLGGLTFNDTWSFSGGVWTQLNPSVTPGGLSYQGMAFDPAMNAVVVFGGYNGVSVLGGTWTY